jgi:hypothetical protein
LNSVCRCVAMAHLFLMLICRKHSHEPKRTVG